jgi:hypothetical protein
VALPAPTCGVKAQAALSAAALAGLAKIRRWLRRGGSAPYEALLSASYRASVFTVHCCPVLLLELYLYNSTFMSFSAYLLVESETFTVRSFHWAIKQHTDELGRPAARVEGGTIDITLDSQPNETLHFWAIDNTKRFDGVLNVLEEDSQAIRDQLKFFGAYCVGLNKQFQDANSTPGMTMHLTLSADKLEYGEVAIDNKWPNTAA